MPPGVKPGFAKGVTLSVKERVLTSFCHLDIVGCLLKKGPQRGVHGKDPHKQYPCLLVENSRDQWKFDTLSL